MKGGCHRTSGPFGMHGIELSCTFAEWLLRKGATKWEEWLQRHGATCIRRLIGWQSAPRHAWDAALVQHIGMRERSWRRERIGRPRTCLRLLRTAPRGDL